MMNATPCAVLSSAGAAAGAASIGCAGTVGACSCGSSAGCTTGALGIENDELPGVVNDDEPDDGGTNDEPLSKSDDELPGVEVITAPSATSKESENVEPTSPAGVVLSMPGTSTTSRSVPLVSDSRAKVTVPSAMMPFTERLQSTSGLSCQAPGCFAGAVHGTAARQARITALSGTLDESDGVIVSTGDDSPSASW